MVNSLGQIFDYAGEDCQEADYLFCGLKEKLQDNVLHPCEETNVITASDHIAAAYQQVWADDAAETGWVYCSGQYHPYILFAPETDMDTIESKGYIYQVPPNHFDATTQEEQDKHIYHCSDTIKVNKGHAFNANLQTAMQYGLLIFVQRNGVPLEQTKALLDHYTADRLQALQNHAYCHNLTVHKDPLSSALNY